MNRKPIVIDTNVLISAVLRPNGTARKAIDKAYREFIQNRSKSETPRMTAGGLKKPESDLTHSTSRTTLWARVKDLPRDAKLSLALEPFALGAPEVYD